MYDIKEDLRKAKRTGLIGTLIGFPLTIVAWVLFCISNKPMLIVPIIGFLMIWMFSLGVLFTATVLSGKMKED